MSDILPSGKLPHDLLEELLRRYTTADESVVQGPATGIDATLLRAEGPLLIVKTDPVTFLSDDLGYYLVNVNANDLAAMGGEPKWFLASLLFPHGATGRAEIEAVFRGIREACDEIPVSFCGGHTEVTDAVTRVVACGAMLGRPMGGRSFQAPLARAGDSIVLTKGVSVEGTSIIARTRAAEVRAEWGDGFLARCRNFIREPGMGVLAEARIASRLAGVHAMHDPTEGGLATALHEVADASGTGFVVEESAIHVYPETRLLAGKYGIDPMGLIASGSLLIAVEPAREGELVEALAAEGIRAAVIGRLVEDPGRRSIARDGGEEPLGRFDRDEILKI